MSDDLVAWLRYCAPERRDCGRNELAMLDAADRIKQLEADLVHTFNNMMGDAKRIEKLEGRILLLESWLNGSLNIIEAFVCADTTEARKALEEKDD